MRPIREAIQKKRAAGSSMGLRLLLYWFTMVLLLMAAILSTLMATGVLSHPAHQLSGTLDIQQRNTYAALDSQMDALTAQSMAKSEKLGKELDAFLAAVFANAELPISVKTRLGVEKPEEFAAILDIYNRYPICELTIHPRVMRQLYRGQADREAFAAALPQCKLPVCYNGDITTTGQLHALEAEFPTLSGIMIGRGIIADPALFRKALGGPAATKAELRGYLDDLYHGYTELFGSAGCAISRMKGHWFYLIHCFADSEKLEKQLKKLREPWEYETVVNQIFTLPLI